MIIDIIHDGYCVSITIDDYTVDNGSDGYPSGGLLSEYIEPRRVCGYVVDLICSNVYVDEPDKPVDNETKLSVINSIDDRVICGLIEDKLKET